MKFSRHALLAAILALLALPAPPTHAQGRLAWADDLTATARGAPLAAPIVGLLIPDFYRQEFVGLGPRQTPYAIEEGLFKLRAGG